MIEVIDVTSDKTRTTCPYCGVGCGVVVRHDKSISVEGDQQHPANYGRLCVKGSNLHETLDLNDRLLFPQIDGKRVDWQTATSYVAQGLNEIIKKYGSDAVGFYVSGQLLIEDYYVANKLMKGFIGSGNIDTNSRLCMSSAVAAYKRAFGEDIVPGCYNDIDHAELIVLVGSNTAYAHPIVFQRIQAAKKNNPNLNIIVIDPRRTATCEIADIHLSLKPGTDAYLFNGLLWYLNDRHMIDHEFVQNHTEGFSQTLAAVSEQIASLQQIADICCVDVEVLESFYQHFASTEKVVTVFSQGINQSSSGSDKGNAIINCHLATGAIGKPGAMPFAITGQPNAMGGREVGGLANQLAAHLDPANAGHREMLAEFWQARNMFKKEGLKAIDMMEAIDRGEIKAVWIMATNPLVSMPDADFVKAALQKCELVIVSDCMQNTDTAAIANVLFPASTWGEKTGTVTNSERCISLQKAFLPQAGEAKPDWKIISEVAVAMGFAEAFPYQHGADIFTEYAALTGLENDNSRALDISAYSQLSVDEYMHLPPRQWPINTQFPDGRPRLFDDKRYFTLTGKAQFVPIQARLPAFAPKTGQLILNTGRVRDQWHTMTRTGKSARLISHVREPYVQIHPDDAMQIACTEGDLLSLTNKGHEFIGRVQISQEQQQGSVFVPIHWNSNFAAKSRVGVLVNTVVDPQSGQPEFKHTPVRVEKWTCDYHGLLLVSSVLKYGQTLTVPSNYWVKIPHTKGVEYILAGDNRTKLMSQIKAEFKDIDDWVELYDPVSDSLRLMGFQQNHFVLALLVANHPTGLPSSEWLVGQLGAKLASEQRFKLLAAKSAGKTEDKGAIICSCFQVGKKQIQRAIDEGCESTETLGQKLKCGTNCGSCIPELEKLLSEELVMS